MFGENKRGDREPVQELLLEMPPARDVPAKERAQIAQLIANGKFGFALDIAKQVHKRCNNAASEALLVDVYVARISSLAERNLDREAMALIDLIRQRYPKAADRLREVMAVFDARKGAPDALLELLDDPACPAEKRAAIAQSIRRDVTDLLVLSRSGALGPEHPLRTGAAALAGALEAVTSGLVEDQALAFPEISHRSPLAPWKTLLRAIAAFYRRDDELCEKCLAAIEPDAAAARLAPALRALMGQTPALTPAALSLVNQVGGSVEALRSALQRLDQALDRKNKPLALQEIRNAVAACKQGCPGLLERLKQHIGVRAWLADLKADRVAAAMDGGSLKDAYFWRLLARAAEEHREETLAIPYACSHWEEFRKHAVHEGWFPAKGPEAAALYLHMADLLHRLPEQAMKGIRKEFAGVFRGHAEHYQGQPPAIRALQSAPAKQDFYFLHAEAILERACDADPCAGSFQRWLDWARRNRPAAGNRAAERWRAAFPNDIPPLLYLMEAAEKTNALKRAFEYMELAERADGVHPEVRKARLRLLISMATRHLQQKKPRLAEPELDEIEALPQAQQGDRPAFVAALRRVWCELRNDQQGAAAARAEAVHLLGSELAALIVCEGVARACKLKPGPPEPRLAAAPAVAAVSRACALGEDMGVPIDIPRPLAAPLLKELSRSGPAPDPPGLGALGEAALRAHNLPLAYAVSGAGLAGGAAGQARFLFLRARALPPWEEERRNECIAAASELARRQRDPDLLHKIGEWREAELDWMDVPEAPEAAMSANEISGVIQEEKERPAYPKSRPRRIDPDDCDCPMCRATREGFPPELENMLDEFGPEVVARALSEVLTEAIKPKRGKRRRGGVFNDDVPF
jgi:hypothetical protein